ncbi:MAG: recombinase family protein [Deltaproteobacteria bacterium]|nr:recombinase family protein [Deltaproteobacteria bacterium]
MEPTRTVAYLRVSTDKQAEHGVSLDAQRAKVEAYARLYDLDLIEVIEDAGQSAGSLARPGLQHALSRLREGDADALLVVKLDRLTRSVRYLGDLLEAWFHPGGYALMSVSENIDTRSAAGRLVLNVLASVAQWEREVIGERTRTALEHKRTRREYTGGRLPFGWRLAPDGRALEEEPSEQVVIEAAQRLRRQGLSLRQVILGLARQGHVSREGTTFSLSMVSKMVKEAA